MTVPGTFSLPLSALPQIYLDKNQYVEFYLNISNPIYTLSPDGAINTQINSLSYLPGDTSTGSINTQSYTNIADANATYQSTNNATVCPLLNTTSQSGTMLCNGPTALFGTGNYAPGTTIGFQQTPAIFSSTGV